MLNIVAACLVLIGASEAVNNTLFTTVTDAFRSVHSNYHHGVFHGPYHHHHPPTTVTPKPPTCPIPNDPSAKFVLDASAALEATYPIALIATELGIRPDLTAILSLEIPANSGTDLTVPADVPFDQAEMKCEMSAANVWTFQSAQGRGVCWVLQGFQDPVFAINCVDPVCKGCDNKMTTSTTHNNNIFSPTYNPFNDYFFRSLNLPPYFGHQTNNLGPQTNNVGPTYQNICTPRFDVRTIWAFCPLSTDVLKIVREQIIVPVGCNCRKIQCPQP